MMLENIPEDTVDHSLGASLSLSLSIYWEIMNLILTMIYKINFDCFNLFIVMQLFDLIGA